MCIDKGLALTADPSKQDFGGLGSPPFLAYWDRQLSCEYCNQDWVFTAEEQIFWYETLGTHVRAYPTGCKQCRKKVKLAKDAQQGLMHTATRPPEDIPLLAVARHALRTLGWDLEHGSGSERWRRALRGWAAIPRFEQLLHG